MITHVKMHADSDVRIFSYQANGETYTELDVTGRQIRHSILGNILTIENDKSCSDTALENVKLPTGTGLNLKSVVVEGCGTLSIYASDLQTKLIVEIFHLGGVDMEDDGNGIFSKLQLNNHGTGKIKGNGCTTETLRVKNTSTGTISGFVVEKEFTAIVSGSGQTTVEKLSSCLSNVKHIPLSTGRVHFI